VETVVEIDYFVTQKDLSLGQDLSVSTDDSNSYAESIKDFLERIINDLS